MGLGEELTCLPAVETESSGKTIIAEPDNSRDFQKLQNGSFPHFKGFRACHGHRFKALCCFLKVSAAFTGDLYKATGTSMSWAQPVNSKHKCQLCCLQIRESVACEFTGSGNWHILPFFHDWIQSNLQVSVSSRYWTGLSICLSKVAVSCTYNPCPGTCHVAYVLLDHSRQEIPFMDPKFFLTLAWDNYREVNNHGCMCTTSSSLPAH